MKSSPHVLWLTVVHKAKLCKQESEHLDWGKDQLGIVMSLNILLFTVADICRNLFRQIRVYLKEDDWRVAHALGKAQGGWPSVGPSALPSSAQS